MDICQAQELFERYYESDGEAQYSERTFFPEPIPVHAFKSMLQDISSSLNLIIDTSPACKEGYSLSVVCKYPSTNFKVMNFSGFRLPTNPHKRQVDGIYFYYPSKYGLEDTFRNHHEIATVLISRVKKHFRRNGILSEVVTVDCLGRSAKEHIK